MMNTHMRIVPYRGACAFQQVFEFSSRNPGRLLCDKPVRSLRKPTYKRALTIDSSLPNLKFAVTKQFENSSLADISKAPVNAIEGIGVKREEALNVLSVKLVSDLGTWKYYRLAKAITTLAGAGDVKGELGGFNIDKAVDKEHRGKA